MTNSEALIEAGKIYPGAHVCESEAHLLLMRLAQGHAEYMASVGVQGHQHFQQRWDQVNEQLGLSATEIAAESWAEQADAPLLDLGKEMFHCWEQSPGHWRVASKKHKFFGAAMEKCKRNGVWYACILTAD